MGYESPKCRRCLDRASSFDPLKGFRPLKRSILRGDRRPELVLCLTLDEQEALVLVAIKIQPEAMRRTILVLAASCCLASANYGRDLFGMGIPLPMETGALNVQPDTTGWTPRPTEPPRKETVLELLRRGRPMRIRQDTDTWINDETCGWFSESSSESFTCETSYTCATNNQNVVGCVSGTSSAFFTACFDHQAFLQSACVSIGIATGCCTDAAWPACGTLLWAGTPAKSMYRCFPQQTIISMLDQPRVVLESLTRSTSTPSSSSSSSNSETQTSSTASVSNTPNPDTSDSSNLGAIVGGVVGGVAGLAAIAGIAALLIIRRRGKKYSAIAPADPAPYSGAGPALTRGSGPSPASQGMYPPQSSPQMAMMTPGAGGANGPYPLPAPATGATTYPPTSPYAQTISTTTTAYDPHQSYYEPPKPPAPSPGQQYAAYQPPYPQAQSQASPPQQFQPQMRPVSELDNSMAGHHQGHMSELDSMVPTMGHQYNPAEMGGGTPRPQ